MTATYGRSAVSCVSKSGPCGSGMPIASKNPGVTATYDTEGGVGDIDARALEIGARPSIVNGIGIVWEPNGETFTAAAAVTPGTLRSRSTTRSNVRAGA